MMRGHITAYTLDGLDSTTRDELLHQLQEARDADQNAALIARDPRPPRRAPARPLRPRTPLGHLPHRSSGTTATSSPASAQRSTSTTATTSPVDFDGTSVDDLLTDMYGARGAVAALGVDLRTGALEFDDYGDNVPDLLGIPTNDHSDGDGCAIYATDHTVIRDGVEVSITDLCDGDVFIDYDDTPWLAARVGRDGYDVHVDIQPAADATTKSPATPADPIPGSPPTP